MTKEKLQFKYPYQNQVNEQAAEGQRRARIQGGKGENTVMVGHTSTSSH